MPKHLSLLLALILLVALPCCRTIPFSDYVRTHDNEKLIYKFTKDSAGHTITYYDTLICRMLVRRHVLREDAANNHVIFYFDTPNHPDTGARDVFTTDIPIRAFTYSFVQGNLYMADYIPRNDNPLFYSLTKVIPKHPKTGQTYTYKNGDYKKTFTFLKREDLVWDSMSLKRTFKVAVAFTSRQGRKTTDTIWLARKWGLVQWKKTDGATGQMLN